MTRASWLAAWIGLALLLLGTATTWAAIDPPTLEATLDRDTVQLGEELQLTLTVTLEGDLSQVKAENVTIQPPVGIIEDTSRSITSQIQNQRPDGTTSLVYTIQKFYRAEEAGTFEFDPIELKYEDAGSPGVARIPGPTVTVEDPNAPAATPPAATPPTREENPGTQASGEEEGLRDNRAIEPAPVDFGLIFTIAGSLLLLTLATLIYLNMRNRKRVKEAEEPVYVPPVGLLQRTIARLEAIPEPADMVDAQAVADYYLAITNLAKEYLSDRYGLRATERTTWELRQEYRTLYARRGFDDTSPYLPAFRALFELCDGGKYAHLHATRELMAEAKVRAKAFFETDHRLPGGATIPIGLQPDAPVELPREAALQGAAKGMKIRQVKDDGVFPDAKQPVSKAVPRATQVADAALESPIASGTLFTAADSAALVRKRVAAAESVDQTAAS